MHIKSKWTTYIGVFMLIGCSLIGCGQSGAISEDELSALLSCGPKAKITLPTHIKPNFTQPTHTRPNFAQSTHTKPNLTQPPHTRPNFTR